MGRNNLYSVGQRILYLKWGRLAFDGTIVQIRHLPWGVRYLVLRSGMYWDVDRVGEKDILKTLEANDPK